MVVAILVLGFLAGSSLFATALAMALPLWIALLAYMCGGSVAVLLGAAALALLPSRRDRAGSMGAAELN